MEAAGIPRMQERRVSRKQELKPKPVPAVAA
jgi:hypothetical protein